MATTPSPPVFQQPTSIEAAFNRVFGFLVGLGLGPKHSYLLQVRGRKSGKLYSTPIYLVEIGGKRFLVAPRGRTQWVRNVEAAGEIVLKKGRSQQSYSLRPIADADKPELLKAYLDSFKNYRATLLPCPCRFGCSAFCGHRCELSGI